MFFIIFRYVYISIKLSHVLIGWYLSIVLNDKTKRTLKCGLDISLFGIPCFPVPPVYPYISYISYVKNNKTIPKTEIIIIRIQWIKQKWYIFSFCSKLI